MTTKRDPQPAPAWQLRRDVDAVAAHLDPWIVAADPQGLGARLPLLGTQDWITADQPARDAAVAVYVLACLAEREPVVIAARLAAEIAAGRAAHLAALRQASHAIAAGHDWAAESRRPSHAELRRLRGQPARPTGLDDTRSAHQRKESA